MPASIGAFDVIDILLVGFVIYRFLCIVQGTSSYQLLYGIFAIYLLWWISGIYHLHSMNWILDHFFEYIFVIFIILFQDQIKSALIALASTKIFETNDTSKIDQEIEEICVACLALSREKTGALIVFEKKHGLFNYSITGTRLDCRVHSDIIYSLFQNKSPLHDGAIIIYNNLIQAAGCFLPLSKSIEMDRQFGTRHRAAVGITEVSDAISIAVSEETGSINICKNGKYNLIESEDLLRVYLRKYLLEMNQNQAFYSHEKKV